MRRLPVDLLGEGATTASEVNPRIGHHFDELTARSPAERSTLAASENPRCAHHWILEPAIGLRSAGLCKHCGAIRSFRNSPR